MAPADVHDDYYAILEICETADRTEIRASYRRLAMVRHPDKNPDDPNATATFQLLNAAHETLIDATKRRSYDTEHYPAIRLRTQKQKLQQQQQRQHAAHQSKAQKQPTATPAGTSPAWVTIAHVEAASKTVRERRCDVEVAAARVKQARIKAETAEDCYMTMKSCKEKQAADIDRWKELLAEAVRLRDSCFSSFMSWFIDGANQQARVDSLAKRLAQMGDELGSLMLKLAQAQGDLSRAKTAFEESKRKLVTVQGLAKDAESCYATLRQRFHDQTAERSRQRDAEKEAQEQRAKQAERARAQRERDEREKLRRRQEAAQRMDAEREKQRVADETAARARNLDASFVREEAQRRLREQLEAEARLREQEERQTQPATAKTGAQAPRKPAPTSGSARPTPAKTATRGPRKPASTSGPARPTPAKTATQGPRKPASTSGPAQPATKDDGKSRQDGEKGQKTKEPNGPTAGHQTTPPATPDGCSHSAFWPTIQGAQQCQMQLSPSCLGKTRKFAYCCPRCSAVACADCLHTLKPRRGGGAGGKARPGGRPTAR